MTTRSLCLAALAILIGVLVLPALSMMTTETITGVYYPEYQGNAFDKALAGLGNSPGRVYATRVFFSEVGVTESLYFSGDTKAFSSFLEDYSKLKYPKLTLAFVKEDAEHHPLLRIEKSGSGCDGKPVEFDEIRYDWVLSHHVPGSIKGDTESVYLELRPGKVQWDKVRVPKSITVKR